MLWRDKMIIRLQALSTTRIQILNQVKRIGLRAAENTMMISHEKTSLLEILFPQILALDMQSRSELTEKDAFLMALIFSSFKRETKLSLQSVQTLTWKEGINHGTAKV